MTAPDSNRDLFGYRRDPDGSSTDEKIMEVAAQRAFLLEIINEFDWEHFVASKDLHAALSDNVAAARVSVVKHFSDARSAAAASGQPTNPNLIRTLLDYSYDNQPAIIQSLGQVITDAISAHGEPAGASDLKTWVYETASQTQVPVLLPPEPADDYAQIATNIYDALQGTLEIGFQAGGPLVVGHPDDIRRFSGAAPAAPTPPAPPGNSPQLGVDEVDRAQLFQTAITVRYLEEIANELRRQDGRRDVWTEEQLLAVLNFRDVIPNAADAVLKNLHLNVEEQTPARLALKKAHDSLPRLLTGQEPWRLEFTRTGDLAIAIEDQIAEFEAIEFNRTVEAWEHRVTSGSDHVTVSETDRDNQRAQIETEYRSIKAGMDRSTVTEKVVDAVADWRVFSRAQDATVFANSATRTRNRQATAEAAQAAVPQLNQEQGINIDSGVTGLAVREALTAHGTDRLRESARRAESMIRLVIDRAIVNELRDDRTWGITIDLHPTWFNPRSTEDAVARRIEETLDAVRTTLRARDGSRLDVLITEQGENFSTLVAQEARRRSRGAESGALDGVIDLIGPERFRYVARTTVHRAGEVGQAARNSRGDHWAAVSGLSAAGNLAPQADNAGRVRLPGREVAYAALEQKERDEFARFAQEGMGDTQRNLFTMLLGGFAPQGHDGAATPTAHREFGAYSDWQYLRQGAAPEPDVSRTYLHETLEQIDEFLPPPGRGAGTVLA